MQKEHTAQAPLVHTRVWPLGFTQTTQVYVGLMIASLKPWSEGFPCLCFTHLQNGYVENQTSQN